MHLQEIQDISTLFRTKYWKDSSEVNDDGLFLPPLLLFFVLCYVTPVFYFEGCKSVKEQTEASLHNTCIESSIVTFIVVDVLSD